MAIVIIFQSPVETKSKTFVIQPIVTVPLLPMRAALCPRGALAGAPRARAQWGWHVPPSAKPTGEGEDITREGREPGDEAERPGSRPNGKGLNGLPRLLQRLGHP